MARAKQTLGIIVNSDRYFDFVTSLAEAATGCGKVVHMHLLDTGCRFALTDACRRLSRRIRITVCAQSAEKMSPETGGGDLHGLQLAPPQELTRLLKQCDRHVVF